MPQPAAEHATIPAELDAGAVWRWPLDRIARWDVRLLARLTARLTLRQVTEVVNWQLLLPGQDPFILVANHGSRREAVYLSSLCLLLRSGKPIRFLADWNFRLIPGVGYFYDHSGAILVTGKSARPRILNHLKPRFTRHGPPLEQARKTLIDAGSVGVFPEGTVNRRADQLLRGRYGAARLSLELGVPLLPVGLRFLGSQRPDGLCDSGAPLRIEIGRPLRPPQAGAAPSPGQVLAWHREMMTAISKLCGKAWTGGVNVPEDRQPTDTAQPGVAPDQPARGGSVC